MRGDYRGLMVAVLATQCQDYLNGFLRAKGEQKKVMLGRARVALEYIKTRGTGHIFNFDSICLHLGLDPERFRERILAITNEDKAREVLTNLRNLYVINQPRKRDEAGE